MNEFNYNHELWECSKSNFFGKDNESLDEKAIEIMSDHKLWGDYMSKVCIEWFYSPRHNLSKKSINGVAWIGQASMALALKLSAKQTKRLWWRISKDQRNQANKIAKEVISKFKEDVKNA